jgi:Winged helix-turn-helix domain (DUF2582)
MYRDDILRSPLEKGTPVQDTIGTEAAVIWQALHSQGELSLAQLKREVKGKSPLFDWAIGWLAREDKIVLTPEKRSFRVELRKTRWQAAGHRLS